MDTVAVQLADGVPPDQLVLSAAPLHTAFQIIRDGDVLAASPGLPASDPLLVMAGAAGVMVPGPGERAFIATGLQGSGTIEAPGLFERNIALQVEYATVQTEGGALTVVAASPLDEVRRSIDDVRRSLWVGLPLVTVLVGLVAWVVTGRALQPVDSMRAEVEAISHSTLHRRVPVPAGDDEVGRLARTMNAMLDRLEGAAERQQRFVADASHELRSPVAALRTELEVALLSGDAAQLRASVEG
nr:HAMP domain-containing protein [Actinomycetota bacterium]